MIIEAVTHQKESKRLSLPKLALLSLALVHAMGTTQIEASQTSPLPTPTPSASELIPLRASTDTVGTDQTDPENLGVNAWRDANNNGRMDPDVEGEGYIGAIGKLAITVDDAVGDTMYWNVWWDTEGYHDYDLYAPPGSDVMFWDIRTTHDHTKHICRGGSITMPEDSNTEQYYATLFCWPAPHVRFLGWVQRMLSLP